jgi:Protein of unknown function (DUF3300)
MRRGFLALLTIAALAAGARPARAQAPLPDLQPPQYSAAELDRIVSSIALYPDPLLAQVLTASTYPTEIPEAAQWADQHRSFAGAELASAVADDNLPWDPSVQALLPFRSVLDMMARDMPWTEELGNAVLAERGEVMDAVQHMRHQAYAYGYLQPTPDLTVTSGAYIEILPLDPAFIPVPYYDPLIVFRPARRGFLVTTAINYRYRVRLGVEFAPWGWGTTRFSWPEHVVIVNRTPWLRTWANRAVYVHPYEVRRYAGARVERHEVAPRAERRRETRDDRRRR